MIKYRIYSYDEFDKDYNLIATVHSLTEVDKYKPTLVKGYIVEESNPNDPYEGTIIWSR